MKQFLTIVSGFLILTSCFNRTSQGEQGNRELVPYPEKYVHDGYSGIPDSLLTRTCCPCHTHTQSNHISYTWTLCTMLLLVAKNTIKKDIKW